MQEERELEASCVSPSAVRREREEPPVKQNTITILPAASNTQLISIDNRLFSNKSDPRHRARNHTHMERSSSIRNEIGRRFSEGRKTQPKYEMASR